jgi:hypothetical protein
VFGNCDNGYATSRKENGLVPGALVSRLRCDRLGCNHENRSLDQELETRRERTSFKGNCAKSRIR